MRRTRARKITPAKFATVIREYMATDIWKGYADATKTLWGRELTQAEDPDSLGDFLTTEITPADVQEYLDDLSDRPAKQRAALRALRRLDSWAGLRGKVPRQVTFGCEALGSDGGHIPWEPHELELAQKHLPPHLARAVTLAYYSGQRCCDLHRMTFSDVETDGEFTEVHVVQKKTKRELWIPFTDELKATYATWERRVPDNLILSAEERGYKSARTLSQAFARQRDRNPNLAPLKDRGLVMHGLRGGCCLYLSRKGLTDHQIGDLIGMHPAMVARYTRLSSQRKNARTAMAFINKNG